MIELKSYLVGLLKSLEDDYQVEGIKFEETFNGYRLTFQEELDGNENEKGERGEWKRDVEIYVSLLDKEFTKWSYSRYHEVCPCNNCEKPEKEVTDKDKVAPSGSITDKDKIAPSSSIK